MANGPTTSEKPKGLYMRLPARAENVAVVRHALAGLAEQIGMDETGIADLKTVVTEACMNVVVHAYPGESGPLTVEAEPDTEGLTVTVSDSGSGISPQAESERASLKLGLSLIAALSSSFSISGGLDRGTEVMMRLPLRERGGAASDGAGERAPIPEVTGAEIAVGRAVLPRTALAAEADPLAVLDAGRDAGLDRPRGRAAARPVAGGARLVVDQLPTTAARAGLVHREGTADRGGPHADPVTVGADARHRARLRPRAGAVRTRRVGRQPQ